MSRDAKGGVCVQFIIYHMSGKVHESKYESVLQYSMQFGNPSDELHKNDQK